ncbi:LysR family transcriptional regulator [Ideonella livida]|uniref:LysR family transcriptional regulator n=1 Tax=Ideonella livida TaxID=2707176 RepID=A0A7C9TLT4_9BURK|nr:LysR family transcriptional regulator [Ideonella livida]NDY93780.1 LysR family transcriptional regulator [Ideonella livida]
MADIRTLDLNLLKAFDALMDERSVTRAAARLALTQPAVSGMLVRLRDAFEDPLFVRASRGVVPTARAEALAPAVRQVLLGVAALLQPLQFDPAHARLTLNVAATDYALRAVVLPWLAALRAQAPGVRLAVQPVDDGRVVGQLERGEIDLALSTPQAAPPELHARHLFDEHYVCVARTGHPALADGPCTLEAFCAQDHALVSYGGSPFEGATDRALAALGHQRRVVASVGSFLMLPELLRRTDLLAVAPARLVSQEPGLSTCVPPVAVPGFTKIAVWHERSHRDAGQRWARELLWGVCQSY